MRLSLIFLALGSAMALLVAGGGVAGTNPDTDGDGVYDLVDNCVTLANPLQGDTDRDGFGNRCDGDFTNNAQTNAQDAALNNQCLNAAAQQGGDPTGLSASGGVSCFNMDLNENGFVNAQDTALFNQLLNAPAPAPPGPSGLTCAYLFAGAPNLIGRNPCEYDVDGSGPL